VLSGTPTVQVAIYDPETYDNGVNAHGQYDETNHTPSGQTSANEKWEYSLWTANPETTSTAQEIAWADYGEGDNSQSSTNDTWVTPKGFTFNAASYGYTAGTASTYYLVVSSDNGNNTIASNNPGSGSGYDENGYLLRAGPPDPSTWDSADSNAPPESSGNGNDAILNPYANDTLTSDKTQPYYNQTYDFAWAYKYGYSTSLTNAAGTSVATLNASGTVSNGITMQELTDPSINCDNTTSGGTIPIYFGYAAPNPNGPTTISFYGFDEDSGASGVYYTCDSILSGGNPVKFTGLLPTNGYNSSGGSDGTDGNGVWSDPTTSNPWTVAGTPSAATTSVPTGGVAKSNTIIIPTAVGYTGGNWTAYYTTGLTDNTTWMWSNENASSIPGGVYLISTGSNVF